MGPWVSLERNLHQPVCPVAYTELTVVLLTAATERGEEEETAKERENWSFLDIRGTLVTEIIVLQKLLRGKEAIEMCVMAELSSAQVTGRT